jgi:hypothetical protein
MKFTNVRVALFTLLFFAVAAVSPVYGQKKLDRDKGRDRDKDRRFFKHHKPAHWPAQIITQSDITIGPAHVINFKQLADSQLAHPVPSRTGFIGQEEDKDADFKFIPHADTPQGHLLLTLPR